MSKSHRPSFNETQRLTRLVCECIELGTDPLLWRRHLAHGLTQLIPETVALVYEMQPPTASRESGENGHATDAGAGLNPTLIDYGWTDEGAREAFHAYLASGDAAENPLLGVVMSRDDAHLETSAFEVEPAPVWHANPVADYMVAARVEFDCLTHASLRSSNRREVLTLHRHLGSAAWSKRERVLARLLFRSLQPHLGSPLSPIGEPSVLDLPPRALVVLDGFLRGLSSKQVAAERDLSIHTVNEYAKLIHRHFGLQSRGELLARLAGVAFRHHQSPLFADGKE